MDVLDLVAFFAMILVLIGPILRRIIVGREDDEFSEEEVKQQRKDVVKELFESLDMEWEDDLLSPTPSKKTPPPPPPPAAAPLLKKEQLKKKFDFHSKFDDYEQVSRFEDHDIETQIQDDAGRHLVSGYLKDKPKQEAYRIKEKATSAYLKQKVKSRRDLMIMHELLSPPKSLRHDELFK